MINRTDADWKDTTNGGKVGKSNGGDILFTSSDGTTKLNHEIEKYVSTTGELVAWVNVPTLSTSVDTVLYIYYGNASAADQWNITATWETNFKGVWHLKEDPSGTAPQMKDSTTNALNLTSAGTMTTSDSVAGQIGNALDFDSINDVVSRANPGQADADLTMSIWTYARTAGSTGGARAFALFNSAANQVSLRFHPLGTNAPRMLVGFGTNISVNGADNDWPLNTWVHWVIRFRTSDNLKELLKNGVVLLSNTADPETTTIMGNILVGAVSTTGTEPFDGLLDEFHWSNGLRSNDWIKTEYNNQSSPSTFYAAGAEESASTAAIVGDTITISGYGFGVAIGVDRADCTTATMDKGCVKFIVGGTTNVASGDITSWSNTQVVFTVSSSLATTGGTDALEMRAANQADNTPLTLIIISSLVTTIGSAGTQVATLTIPSSDQYVGGAFTFIRSTGTSTITQIMLTETGTVNANANILSVKLLYKTEITCSSSIPAGTTAFNTVGVNFNASEKVTVTGSMTVTTLQVCVYVKVTISSSATNNQTLDIQIANPSTDVTVAAGSVAPATAVAISGSTTLSTSAGGASSTLSLKMADPAKDPTVFSLSNGVLFIQEGTNPAIALTSNSVTVTSLQFTNLSYSNTPGAIRIQITIQSNNPSNRQEYTFSQIFYATANVRKK